MSNESSKNLEQLFGNGISQFLKLLTLKYTDAIHELLEDRKTNPVSGFIPETRKVRESNWRISAPVPQIVDRRVEITGPTSRKMVINALNSGANVFMADFEDSNSPTWENCVNGQVNLYDAIRNNIDFTSDTGKEYKLNKEVARLFVRPRGLHLVEKNIVIGGQPMAAALFDYGVFIYNNITYMVENGEVPCFYLPKLEHWKEAKLWAEIFSFTEKLFEIKKNTIKATVLVETFPLVFQMNEVIHALGEYSAGLNCGRWDYIFSFIKHHPESPLPDRSQIGMQQHFMRSYSQLLVQTCHRRGVHAMGGMAAQIPIKNDSEKNATAMKKISDDKLREVLDGHDGTWVAHPGLISTAKEIFDRHMPTLNQIHKDKILNSEVTEADLSCVPIGTCTEETLVENINVGFIYLKNWIDGNGCVPINDLMEDAATAEISRTQIWQWLKCKVTMDSGNKLTKKYFLSIFNKEMEKYENHKAKEIFLNFCTSDVLEEFITNSCYEHI